MGSEPCIHPGSTPITQQSQTKRHLLPVDELLRPGNVHSGEQRIEVGHFDDLVETRSSGAAKQLIDDKVDPLTMIRVQLLSCAVNVIARLVRIKKRTYTK